MSTMPCVCDHDKFDHDVLPEGSCSKCSCIAFTPKYEGDKEEDDGE